MVVSKLRKSTLPLLLPHRGFHKVSYVLTVSYSFRIHTFSRRQQSVTSTFARKPCLTEQAIVVWKPANDVHAIIGNHHIILKPDSAYSWFTDVGFD